MEYLSYGQALIECSDGGEVRTCEIVAIDGKPWASVACSEDAFTAVPIDHAKLKSLPENSWHDRMTQYYSERVHTKEARSFEGTIRWAVAEDPDYPWA